MSEPDLPDLPEYPAGTQRIHDAMLGLTGCIGEALSVCSYGWTIGEAYVPFKPDPEAETEADEDDACDENDCDQAWTRIVSITPEVVPGFDGGACEASLTLDLEIGVIRCLPIPEEGEAPTDIEMLAAAMQATADMQAIYCAAMNCEVWESINPGQWAPFGPLGGQHGGTWTFTVTLP